MQWGDPRHENVLSVPSVAHVNIQGLGKLFALNISCIVLKLLFVVILPSFHRKFIGKVRF